MTNLEWLRTLTAEELCNIWRENKCKLCAYQEREVCPTNATGYYDCKGGFKKWCNATHISRIKPCPVCKGEMGIKYREGYYLICHGCGLHFGIAEEESKEGIIEGGYPTEETLIDTWNQMLDTED